MKVDVFKFFNSNYYSMCAFFEKGNECVRLNLLLDGDVIDSVATHEEYHSFDIVKNGKYKVELFYMDESNSEERVESSEINFTKVKERRNHTPGEYVGLPGRKKTTNRKLDDINKYYLEIKILKEHFGEIKDKLNLNLRISTIKLSGINNKHPVQNYLYLIYDGSTDFYILNELAKKIEQLDFVVYCSVSPDTTGYLPPSTTSKEDGCVTKKIKNLDDDFITPDFTPLQTYLNEPHGMNIRKAWDRGINGSRSVVHHLDHGVYRNHEDLKDSNLIVIQSRPETDDCDHGTASCGCIIGTKNDFGVTGIAYGCTLYFYDTGYLDLIVDAVKVGDIVSLDMQFQIDGQFFPVVVHRSWWERIKIMVDKGAIVIYAAGNSDLDLSAPGVMEDFGDNGGMLVGACNHDNGKRLYISNYNHPTSLLNSWGDWTVVTTGYSSLQELPGKNRNYTRTYSATSSATPLCSAALALIQDYAKSNHVILSAWNMREIIKNSNYKEGLDDGIGYRPNVDLLFTKVDGLILSELTNVYPEGFINHALFLYMKIDKDKNSELTYSFDYDNAQVHTVGFVCVYPEQGPTDVLWYEFGETRVKVPLVGDDGNIEVIYLRVSKINRCGTFVMNTTSPCGSSAPDRFDLVIKFLKEDNLYLEGRRFKGSLPLYAKSWIYIDYVLNVMINIDLE